MEAVVKSFFGWVFRLTLLLAGLVFFASLLAAAVLLLAVWLLRALWARLTGQPVSPWTFQFNRSAVMSRFYRPPGGARSSGPDDANVIDAEVKEVASDQLPLR